MISLIFTVIYFCFIFLLYFLAFPEIIMTILLATSDKIPTRGYDTGVGFLETILTYMHSLLIGMSPSGRVIFIIIISIIYLALLSIVRYKGIPVLFILSNILTIYVVCLVVSSFKLTEALNTLAIILLSIMSIGIKISAFEKVSEILEDIFDIDFDKGKYTYQEKEFNNYDNIGDDFSKDHEETIIFTIQEKNPYKILGVSPNEDLETIRKVYRKLSKVYHPDISELSTDDKFKEISEAMEEIEKEKSNN